MTDRRSFFKSLALLGAAAAGCPGIFIPKFEPVKWKVTQREGWKKCEFSQFEFDQNELSGQWRFTIDNCEVVALCASYRGRGPGLWIKKQNKIEFVELNELPL